MKVQDAIYGYLKEILSPSTNFTESSRLVDDLGLDSLDQIELSIYLEEKLDIIIDDEDVVGKANTVGDLISILQKKYGIS